MRNQKTAIVFGSNGLVGQALINQLIRETMYSSIIAYSRKKLNISHPKVENIIIDFENPEIFKEIHGDDLYCCLGTTMKKAQNKDNYRKIDFDLPVNIAKGTENNISNFIFISSIGASKKAKTFYLQLKSQTEEKLKDLLGKKLVIVRPSLLLGKRKEFRFGEFVSKIFFKIFRFIFIGKIKKYKPIYAEQVAKSMIKISGFHHRDTIYENQQLFDLS
jgi:dTDP-4-dehydrorhamnose reductase